jgi:hypothetical protein
LKIAVVEVHSVLLCQWNHENHCIRRLTPASQCTTYPITGSLAVVRARERPRGRRAAEQRDQLASS